MAFSPHNASFLLAGGGFLGFSIVFFSGVYSGRDIPMVLRDASIAMLGGAILMQIFLGVVYQCIQEVRQRKIAELERKRLEEESADETTDSGEYKIG
jgi:hypothetical protein